MPRLLKLLLLTTLMLPPITGLIAVISGFGDPRERVGFRSGTGVVSTRKTLSAGKVIAPDNRLHGTRRQRRAREPGPASNRVIHA